MPFISICIPAYKRIEYLDRLLRSIAMQDFKDFEVVVSDDSPDNSVQELCKQFQSQFSIKLIKNERPLGTPENWNHAIRHAKGDWIKLMHDDDWFSNADSLSQFALAAQKNPNTLIFSSYKNVFLDEDREDEVVPSQMRLNWLYQEPATLFSSNCIGPPSVIMHPRKLEIQYDSSIKWVVDIDFYIRSAAFLKIQHLNQSLINVGMSREQVTVSCIHNPEVEIPENFYLLNKIGFEKLRNWLVYDAFWRLMRNLNIKSSGQIRSAGYHGPLPLSIERMIGWQKRIPSVLLNVGVISKLLMGINYLLYRRLS